MSQKIALPTVRFGKSILFIAAGLGAYLLYIYHSDYQNMIESIRDADIGLFILALSLGLLGVLFDTLAWRVVAARFDCQVPLHDMFFIYLSFIFMNNIIPSGCLSGETARVYFLEKLDKNSRLDRSSATVALTRIITAIPFFVGTAIGLIYLVMSTDAPLWALAFCSAISLVLLLLNLAFLGVCYAKGWLLRIIFILLDYIERYLRVHVDRIQYGLMVEDFHRSMSVLSGHRKTLIFSTIWAFLAWICMTMVAVVVFRSLGVSIPIQAVFAVYSVMIFLQMLPLFLPGGVGLVDIIMSTFFSAVGIAMHHAIAATIIIRIIQLWILTGLGGLATMYLIKKINYDSA